MQYMLRKCIRRLSLFAHSGTRQNKMQSTLKNYTSILQCPKEGVVNVQTNTPSNPPPKTLQQRQDEYAFPMDQIFGTDPTIAPVQNKIYKHPNLTLRSPKA